jgi:hypothetical protein
MTDHSDTDLMAALFVSDGGELGCFSDHTDEPFFYAGSTRWDRLSVPYFLPEPVAAGILRLLRERDEAEKRLDHLRAMLVDLVKELPSDSPLSTSLYRVLFP